MCLDLEHGGKLEKDIIGDTSGHYQRLLVILIQVKKKTQWVLSLNGNQIERLIKLSVKQ